MNDLKQGDRIRLVYAKEFADGNFVRNGDLLAVQIVRGDEVSEAFRFTSGQAAGFYTLDGRSASQTFMRVPLDVKDVSSEFSPLRRHPVTGVLRAHNGTDLRAPTGSRIFAAADGVIRTIAYEARGYGRYIKIDHGAGRTTVYAHMSRSRAGCASAAASKGRGDRLRRDDGAGDRPAPSLRTHDRRRAGEPQDGRSSH